MADIEQGVSRLHDLGAVFADEMGEEISSIKAKANWESTLEERRELLRLSVWKAKSTVEKRADALREQLVQTQALLLRHDRPAHFIVAIKDGVVVDARLKLAPA